MKKDGNVIDPEFKSWTGVRCATNVVPLDLYANENIPFSSRPAGESGLALDSVGEFTLEELAELKRVYGVLDSHEEDK